MFRSILRVLPFLLCALVVFNSCKSSDRTRLLSTVSCSTYDAVAPFEEKKKLKNTLLNAIANVV